MGLELPKDVLEFISHPYFGNRLIFTDARILLYYSDIFSLIEKYTDVNFFLKQESTLESITLVICENSQFKRGFLFYEDKEILNGYQKLLKQGIELDIFVLSKEEYNSLNVLHINNNIRFSFNYLKIPGNRKLYSHSKFSDNVIEVYNNYGFEKLLELFLFKYLNSGIKGNIIQIIQNAYLNLNIILKIKNILKDKEFLYKEYIINFFLKELIFKNKSQILFFSILQKEGYIHTDNLTNVHIFQKKEVSYLKNICMTERYYTGNVYKVFNKETAEYFKVGSIMVSKDTNPEFINAFINSKLVCVETKSELSHAAITCRELKIPLALGCTGLFLSTVNGDQIKINTLDKKITICKK